MGYQAGALDGVLQPVASARGLPNAFYTDPALFDLEREKLFFAGWAAIGFGKDVRETGDAVPIQFLGQPLLLVRGRDGVPRVFQNVCRHRGMILVAEPRNIRGAIRCPYHSWCYDLEGRLKATPHVGGPGHNTHDEIRRDELGLIEIRSHVWQDIVFVNVSGGAPPFEEAHAALLKRWREFEQPAHFGTEEDSTFEMELSANWKLAIENYCESYHLPWIHPGLNAFSKLEDHYEIEEPGAFSGQGTRVYDPTLSDEKSFPDFKGLGSEWDKQAEYVSLFPNVLLGVHRDMRLAIVLLPQGQERTLERCAMYYASEAATGEGFADLRRTNMELWRGILAEDVFVVEGMQAGRHGRAFDGGKFSPAMDGPTHLFHRWVAEKVSGASP